MREVHEANVKARAAWRVFARLMETGAPEDAQALHLACEDARQFVAAKIKPGDYRLLVPLP